MSSSPLEAILLAVSKSGAQQNQQGQGQGNHQPQGGSHQQPQPQSQQELSDMLLQILNLQQGQQQQPTQQFVQQVSQTQQHQTQQQQLQAAFSQAQQQQRQQNQQPQSQNQLDQDSQQLIQLLLQLLSQAVANNNSSNNPQQHQQKQQGSPSAPAPVPSLPLPPQMQSASQQQQQQALPPAVNNSNTTGGQQQQQEEFLLQLLMGISGGSQQQSLNLGNAAAPPQQFHGNVNSSESNNGLSSYQNNIRNTGNDFSSNLRGDHRQNHRDQQQQRPNKLLDLNQLQPALAVGIGSAQQQQQQQQQQPSQLQMMQGAHPAPIFPAGDNNGAVNDVSGNAIENISNDTGVNVNGVYPMTDIEYPGIHDCMFGRGGGTSNHIGNIHFRFMVEKFKKKYANASKLDKPKVAEEVVAKWRARNPPGRFLTRTMPDDGSMSKWHDVGDKRARRKCAQALREKSSRCREEAGDNDGAETRKKVKTSA